MRIGALSDLASKRIADATRLDENTSWAAVNLVVVLFVTLMSFTAILVWEPGDSILSSYITLSLLLLMVLVVLSKRFDHRFEKK